MHIFFLSRTYIHRQRERQTEIERVREGTIRFRKTTSLPLGHNGALSLGIMHSTGVTNFFRPVLFVLSFLFVPFCTINWERLGDDCLIFLIRCRRNRAWEALFFRKVWTLFLRAPRLTDIAFI